MTTGRWLLPPLGTPRLQMTPLIDVVFLLLVFFLLTFKVVPPEGDFHVSMPAPPSRVETSRDTVPATVRLQADNHGNLASIQFGQHQFGHDFTALRCHIRALGGHTNAPAANQLPAITLDCDYHLRYEYVVEALDAVSGYREGGRVVPLVRDVRFGPFSARAAPPSR